MMQLKKYLKPPIIVACLAVAAMNAAASVGLADPPTFTPVPLGTPVNIIDTTTILPVLFTFVGGTIVMLLVAYMSFAAVGLIWKWLGSFARKGK